MVPLRANFFLGEFLRGEIPRGIEGHVFSGVLVDVAAGVGVDGAPGSSEG